jgi:hypothetical protein
VGRRRGVRRPRPGVWNNACVASRDPLFFDADSEIGVIDAHAAEVIVDEDGAMWVSHCGWGQGGVYLAPLPWIDAQPS